MAGILLDVSAFAPPCYITNCHSSAIVLHDKVTLDSTYQRAHPHHPPMRLIGTAVDLLMIVTILPQAISIPKTKAS